MTDDVAVHHDLDGVALVLVQRGCFRQVVLLPVHADAHEALPPRRLEDAVTLRLAVLHQRPEHEQPRALRQAQDLVDDLLHRLALDLVAVGAVRVADAREQQPQMVVDLRDGPDGRPRIPRGALLVDRDRRRQPVDLVDVRLLHLAQELPRVRRQRFDIPTLAFGVDRVEREAGFAGARQSGDHDEPVTRDRDRDVLEVVFACAANDDLVLGHVPILAVPTEMEQAFGDQSGTVAPAADHRALVGNEPHGAVQGLGARHGAQ